MLLFLSYSVGITNGMVKQTLSLLTQSTYRISCHCLNVFHDTINNMPQCLYTYITMEHFYHNDILIFLIIIPFCACFVLFIAICICKCLYTKHF